MVKVSVIVPVYNGVAYIRECMDSILAQTLKEIEIIPVDAGSTDGTLETLKSYAQQDSRVKLISSDKKSMGYQTNLGIQAASGETIGFCEADDYLAPTMLQSLYIIINKYCLDFVKSDFDMFMDGHTRFFLNYSILGSKYSHLYHKVLCPAEYPELIGRDVNMWNGIYKREFLLDHHILLNETPKAAFQDVGFILQTIALGKRMMYVQEDANRYRRDNVNSSVYDQKSLLFVVWEFEYVYEMLKKRKIEDQRFLMAVWERFLGVFCGFYERLPEISDFTEEIHRAIEKFQQLLLKLYDELNRETQTFLSPDSLLNLRLLGENRESFHIYRKEWAKVRESQLKEFYDLVRKYEKAVIFGAGEHGTSCYAMLRSNGHDGVLCFCDNNPNLWEKERMGLKICSAEKVMEEDKGEFLYVIANAEHGREIYEQLRSLGVEESHICNAVSVIPHNAFEIKIKKE
ncbi:MAG: glycosyltransferase [Lachnospiraceae bacterium]|nr:glycosyltransferase [Lachnospiraceae bacterium]